VTVWEENDDRRIVVALDGEGHPADLVGVLARSSTCSPGSVSVWVCGVGPRRPTRAGNQ
jgi:hypothetical protein